MTTERRVATALAILTLAAAPPALGSDQPEPQAGTGAPAQAAPPPAPPAEPDDDETSTVVVLGVFAGLLALAGGVYAVAGRSGRRTPVSPA